MPSTTQPFNQAFADDIVAGLKATPQRLSSKYFYDDKGSQIFQQIMRMDSYYLTDAEFEIFDTRGESLVNACSPDGSSFRLVEFGAGDGLKTKVLIQHLLNDNIEFTYTPIDISSGALEGLVSDCGTSFPGLKVESLQGDYFEALDRLIATGDTQRKVILFLGSNIGNFKREEALVFLSAIRDHMNPGDRLLIGFDLKKDPNVVLQAYSDPEGITAEFNLNLLDRINRELGGNINRSKWQHYANYDPLSGETKSFLIPTENQQITLSVLNETFAIQAWDPIWTELSQKYNDAMIRGMAQESGFYYLEAIRDSRRYFVEAIWEWA